MQIVKCVWQHHHKKSEMQPVFDYFRSITNEAIRVGIVKNLSSKFKLQSEIYYQLRSEFHSTYVLGALGCATARLKQYKKAKKRKAETKTPFISKNHLILDNQSYKIVGSHVRIPIKPNQYCFMRLNCHVLEQISDVKLGSLTITDDKIIIAYSKNITEKKPLDFVGIDVNLDNVTTCNTQNKFTVYNLKKVNQVKQTYRQVKSKFKRNDVRIKKRIFSKYGKKEKNKVSQLLHLVSKNIVSHNAGIILEDLKGIRKLYRKGNGQGRDFRYKMNSWSFYKLQKQIEYKARWLGLSVLYINAIGTSSKCATCGLKTIPEEYRMLSCSHCNVVIDRDINAAKNILARGIRYMPIGDANEAMMTNGEDPSTFRVDASQLSCKPIR